MPIPVNSYSFPIPCGWLIPTYSAKPTSAIPSACSTLARMNTGVAATSDVNPGRNQDVLDVERVPQRHLDEHAGHRDQQKSGIPKRTGPHFFNISGPPPGNADHGSPAGRARIHKYSAAY